MKKTKDNIFKSLFSDKDLFFMLLKDFVKAPWVKEVTKDSLELVPASFIDSVDENRESDIIYRVKLKENEVFVFVLLEHQSKVNYLMTFRDIE